MKTRLIWILGAVTVICALSLTYIQTRWIYSAIFSERKTFYQAVNNALYMVVDITDEEDMMFNPKPYIDGTLPDSLLAHYYSIPQRLSKERLEELFNKWFQVYKVNFPYEYGVTDNTGNIMLQSEGYKKLSSQYKHYTKKLFSEDPEYVPNYFLNVNVAYKLNPIIRSIALFIYISLALLLTVIVSSSIILIILLRQKRLSEIKNDFTSNVIHELKAPITTISLASQMLEDPSISDKAQRVSSLSNIIQQESKRLSSLVERILQMSIIEQKKSLLQKKEIDMHALITATLDKFSLQIDTLKIAVFTDFQATNPRVLGDETCIAEVLLNLIDNAIKYCKSDVSLQIHIHTKKNGTNFECTISDNGMGIDSGHLKRIFEKFYRIPDENIRNIKGFGLGLNYARKIITMHNGNLWVKSELQKGTTFGFTLPSIDNN